MNPLSADAETFVPRYIKDRLELLRYHGVIITPDIYYAVCVSNEREFMKILHHIMISRISDEVLNQYVTKPAEFKHSRR